ncbi:MAG: hypothetical protein DIZ80_15010 [endosymbiont of Galathealinum brachiosum]|uniref:VanZ-like domain-containing protein n=1 Tax=endosymbiont of Galathealinum brachiosum TaxID=2200906 RepID=A0A370D909_9GAMM|nr:MAG: hypothetical protein DIZ80_15010 [endosymbiont of Galathealinum brachiosum]
MRNIILIITLIMSVMLFTSNPIDNSIRLYQALWNTGHLFFFALLTWLLIMHTALLKESWRKILIVSLLFSLILGGLIEIVQYQVGRYMEWQDLLTDVLGGMLGFLTVQLFVSDERRLLGKPAIILLSIIVILIAFIPVFNVIQDDLNVKSEFPVIANFELERTLGRWDSKHVGRLEIDSQFYIEGAASALVEFQVGKYPDVSLDVLYPNWSGFEYLNMSIHNAQNEILEMELKIYDQIHRQNGYDYNDRFNYELSIKPGWNILKIEIQNILNSPRSRSMDVENIVGFSLFMYSLNEAKVIHLDNIHLSK